MQRMTDVLSRMLNDPATRAALSGGGEDSLEEVIEQRENFRNIENNPESNAERSNESVESSTEPSGHLETTGSKIRLFTCFISMLDSISMSFLGNASVDVNRNVNTDNTDNSQAREGPREYVRNHDQSRLLKISTDVNDDIPIDHSQAREEPQEYNNQSLLLMTAPNVNSDIPIETESSQTRQSQIASTESISSHNRTEHNNIYNQNRNKDEGSCANISSKQENMMENLQDRLTTMRDDFLEK